MAGDAYTQHHWADPRAQPEQTADHASGPAFIATSYQERPFRPATAPLAGLPKLRPYSASPHTSPSGKPSPQLRVSPKQLGRMFGQVEGVLKPTARLAHTDAMTQRKDKEGLAEEWHQLLCAVDPNHPEYVQTPLADNLDPYTLAYTSLLLKEAAAGALPDQVTGMTTCRPMSARRDVRAPADVTAFISLLDQLLDGAISRIREAGEMKPSGRGRYDFNNMTSDDRIGVLKRIYGRGRAPRKVTLSNDTRSRLHDHLRLGRTWVNDYGGMMPEDENNGPSYADATVQVDCNDSLAEALERERAGERARQREAIAAALERERAAARKRQEEAIAAALTEQQAQHDAALAKALASRANDGGDADALEAAIAAAVAAALARERALHDAALAKERAEAEARLREAAEQAVADALAQRQEPEEQPGGKGVDDVEQARLAAEAQAAAAQRARGAAERDRLALGGLSPDAVVAWMNRIHASNAKLRAVLLGMKGTDGFSPGAAELSAMQQALQAVQDRVAHRLPLLAGLDLAPEDGASAAAGPDGMNGARVVTSNGNDIHPQKAAAQQQAGTEELGLQEASSLGMAGTAEWLQAELMGLAQEMQALQSTWVGIQGRLDVGPGMYVERVAGGCGEQSREVLVLQLQDPFAAAGDDGPPPLPSIAALLELLSTAGCNTTSACSTACSTYLGERMGRVLAAAPTHSHASASAEAQMNAKPPIPFADVQAPASTRLTTSDVVDPLEFDQQRPSTSGAGPRLTTSSSTVDRRLSQSGNWASLRQRLSRTQPRISEQGKRMFVEDGGEEPAVGGKLRPSSRSSQEQIPYGSLPAVLSGQMSSSGTVQGLSAAREGAVVPGPAASSSEADADDRTIDGRRSLVSTVGEGPGTSVPLPVEVIDMPATDNCSHITKDQLSTPTLPQSTSIQASAVGQVSMDAENVRGMLANAMLQVARLLATSNALLTTAERMLEAQQAPPPWLNNEDGLPLGSKSEPDEIATRSSTSLAEAADAAGGPAAATAVEATTLAGQGVERASISTGSAEHGVQVVEASKSTNEAAQEGSSSQMTSGTQSPEAAQPAAQESSVSRQVVGLLLSQVRTMQAAVTTHLGGVLAALDELSRGCNSDDVAAQTAATGSLAQIRELLAHLHGMSQALIAALRQLAEAGSGLGGACVLDATLFQGAQATASHLDEMVCAFESLALAGGDSGKEAPSAIALLWSLQPVLQGYLLNLGLCWRLWTRGMDAAWTHARNVAAQDLQHAKGVAQAQSDLLLGHMATLQELLSAASLPKVDQTAAASAADETDLLRTMVDSMQSQLQQADVDALHAELREAKQQLEEMKARLEAEPGKMEELRKRILDLERQLADQMLLQSRIDELERRIAEKSRHAETSDKSTSPDVEVVEKGCCGC